MPEQSNNRKATPQEALHSFLHFIEDPLLMDEDELDIYLSQADVSFEVFSTKLDEVIESATKKGRLVAAKESRLTFKQKIQRTADLTGLTIERKRTEIQQRLGLLGGQAATMFNRNYELAEDEEDLDELLVALRSLDERSEEVSD